VQGACLNPDEWGYGAADYGGPLTLLARVGIAALALLLWPRRPPGAAMRLSVP
jgi:hypothetical protein